MGMQYLAGGRREEVLYLNRPAPWVVKETRFWSLLDPRFVQSLLQSSWYLGDLG